MAKTKDTTNSVSVKPIIFSGEMVRALLNGTKTQTRRVISPNKKFPHDNICRPDLAFFDHQAWFHGEYEAVGVMVDAPYSVGDLMWVRETWSHTGQGVWKVADAYQALGGDIVYRADEENGSIGYFPSIHMPRWASRLTLRVTNVRAERLQDISRGDAILEGASMRPACNGFMSRYDGWSMDWAKVGDPSKFGVNGVLTEQCISLGDPQAAFLSYWTDLYGEHETKSVGANPWVWVYEFEVIRKNVGEVN